VGTCLRRQAPAAAAPRGQPEASTQNDTCSRDQDDGCPPDCQAASKRTQSVGTSQVDKRKHHERIVAIAARLVREKGVEGIGIADLMKDVGLTHGGFYRHFASRDDLIYDAVECALSRGTQRVASESKSSERSLDAFIDEYLSASHRDSPGTGCALVPLSGEAWRAGKRVRQAYTRQVKWYLALIDGALGGRRRSAARRDSMLALSALVGAVAIARSVDDGQLSDDLLSGTAAALKSLLAR
jgi:TetR/AcrR family transcriptional repressor of nem operon